VLPEDNPFPPLPFEPETEMLTPVPPGDPVIVLLERFAQLHLERIQLKAALEENEKRMERLQVPLRSFFLAHPDSSHHAHGVTVYLKRDLWVRPRVEGDSQSVCDALRATGLGHYVHDAFNTSSLSKYVRDLEKLHADEIEAGTISDISEVLPAPLVQVLNVEPTYKVQGRRGKS
jgi:hypothetical protein